VILLAALAAASFPVQPYRYARPLQPAGPGPVELVPDGALYAHTRPGFADLRVVDAAGEQVPWRPEPEPQQASERTLPVLDRGRRGAFAVARVDLGPTDHAVDRVVLDVPDQRFVGSVTVLGSDDRTSWTTLGTTEIYAVGGAAPARSTTAVLSSPSDFRYLELRATHVSRIDRVTVAATPKRAALVRVPAAVQAGPSVVNVDLGHPHVPVDELQISAGTPRYNRAFTVESGGVVVAAGRLVRVGGGKPTVVPLAVRTKRLRIVIENGDDPPLRGIRVSLSARPRTLLIEGGHPGPLALYYGGPARAPVYDYARLPRSALALARAKPGFLGAEVANPKFSLVDRRSFFARHRSLVTVALALAALAVIGAAGLALRRNA
jgi:hypothetical protein